MLYGIDSRRRGRDRAVVVERGWIERFAENKLAHLEHGIRKQTITTLTYETPPPPAVIPAQKLHPRSTAAGRITFI